MFNLIQLSVLVVSKPSRYPYYNKEASIEKGAFTSISSMAAAVAAAIQWTFVSTLLLFTISLAKLVWLNRKDGFTNRKHFHIHFVCVPERTTRTVRVLNINGKAKSNKCSNTELN